MSSLPADSLPELPLMLADLPRGVERLLRDAGVPAVALPSQELLTPGTGRFALFDSSRRASVAQAQVARRLGLAPIDLRDLCPRCDELESVAPVPHGHGWSATSSSLLRELMLALESRGGIWARLADFPFPFQSALCLSVEYDDVSVTRLPELRSALSTETTHFVPSRFRPDSVAGLQPIEIGWRIGPEDCLSSSRRTVSHWKTRLERFETSLVAPSGILLADPACKLPATSSLWELGLRYLAQPHSASPRIGAFPGGNPAVHWVDAGLSWLPPRDRFLEWVAEHYHSGQPLFVIVKADRIGAAEDLSRFHRDAERCSLLWQTSLAKWSKFWSARRQVRFEVTRQADGVLIQAIGDLPNGAWGVELWRGGHFATLPLRLSGMRVADEGLPYLLAPHRNPAGCAVPGVDLKSDWNFKPQSSVGTAVG
ncbi:MAG: hypothetical protein NT069_24435 [Planctomycetota bacterium]|nr:hypothetical protein [Planctomycetota bacterium]